MELDYLLPLSLIILTLFYILAKRKFNYWKDRGVPFVPPTFPFGSAQKFSIFLFGVGGSAAKHLREGLTPAFTPGKMRIMHSTVMAVAERFSAHIRPAAEMKGIVDFKQLCGMYTTDIIGNHVYGLDRNSMKDPENEFRKYGKRFFEPTQAEFMKELFATAFSESGQIIGPNPDQ